jgi:hypothetical protein
MSFTRIASLTSGCGEWHFYDYGALQIALAALTAPLSDVRREALGEPLRAVSPPARDPALTEEVPALLGGFSIEHWAAYAKLKARIASSVCKENARLKRLSSTEPPGGLNGVIRHTVDHVYEADPWHAARAARTEDRVLARSACGGTGVDVWSNWRGTCRDTRLDDGASSLVGSGDAHSMHEKGSETTHVDDEVNSMREDPDARLQAIGDGRQSAIDEMLERHVDRFELGLENMTQRLRREIGLVSDEDGLDGARAGVDDSMSSFLDLVGAAPDTVNEMILDVQTNMVKNVSSDTAMGTAQDCADDNSLFDQTNGERTIQQSKVGMADNSLFCQANVEKTAGDRLFCALLFPKRKVGTDASSREGKGTIKKI